METARPGIHCQVGKKHSLLGRFPDQDEAVVHLDSAQQMAAPAAQRLKALTGEIADIKRRIERQVENLEAEDITPALRGRIAGRIAELEQAVEEREERARRLAGEAADAPPTAAELGAALDQLPVMAERLPRLPQPEMRSLLDSLQLQLAYQPAAEAVDDLTLLVDEPPDRRGEVAEVWSVPRGESDQACDVWSGCGNGYCFV